MAAAAAVAAGMAAAVDTVTGMAVVVDTTVGMGTVDTTDGVIMMVGTEEAMAGVMAGVLLLALA